MAKSEADVYHGIHEEGGGLRKPPSPCAPGQITLLSKSPLVIKKKNSLKTNTDTLLSKMQKSHKLLRMKNSNISVHFSPAGGHLQPHLQTPTANYHPFCSAMRDTSMESVESARKV